MCLGRKRLSFSAEHSDLHGGITSLHSVNACLQAAHSDLSVGHTNVLAVHSDIPVGHDNLRAVHSDLPVGHPLLRAVHTDLSADTVFFEPYTAIFRSDKRILRSRRLSWPAGVPCRRRSAHTGRVRADSPLLERNLWPQKRDQERRKAEDSSWQAVPRLIFRGPRVFFRLPQLVFTVPTRQVRAPGEGCLGWRGGGGRGQCLSQSVASSLWLTDKPYRACPWQTVRPELRLHEVTTEGLTNGPGGGSSRPD